MSKVFVLDTNKQALNPVHSGRARILLSSGQAAHKKFKHGFHTGDLVKAVVPAHLKNAGTHVGRMSAKANGAFTIAMTRGTVTDISKKYCRLLQRADGYGYTQKGEAAFPPAPKE